MKMTTKTMTCTLLDGRSDERQGREASKALLAGLRTRGYETQEYVLRQMKIAPCLGCFGCWVRTPGECLRGDDARLVTRSLVQCDLLLVLTPIVFGGYGPELKKALDRSISILSPFFQNLDGETHHKRRYSRYPRFAAIGLLQGIDEESEEIFRTLVSRNAINIFAPEHAVEVAYEDEAQASLEAKVRRLLERVEVAA